MNFEKITQLAIKSFGATKKFLIDNGPIILSAKACIGIISTSILASKATVKSVKAIEEREMRTGLTLNKKEKVKLCAPYYIPAIIEGTFSIGCGIGGIRLFVKDLKSKTTVILAYEELIDKIKSDTLSEFTKNVKDNIEHQNTIGNSEEKTPIIFNKHTLGEGDILCTEPYTNQKFVISKDHLDYIANQIQALHLSNASDDRPTTLNDVLYALDLPTSKILGDIVGWDFNEERHIAMNFNSCLLEDSTPAMVVEFNPHPWLL